jgi:hypothetical protein
MVARSPDDTRSADSADAIRFSKNGSNRIDGFEHNAAHSAFRVRKLPVEFFLARDFPSDRRGRRGTCPALPQPRPQDAGVRQKYAHSAFRVRELPVEFFLAAKIAPS